jgi:hypothetical protein
LSGFGASLALSLGSLGVLFLPALLAGTRLVTFPTGPFLPALLGIGLVMLARQMFRVRAAPAPTNIALYWLVIWGAAALLIAPPPWDMGRATPEAQIVGAWIAQNADPTATLALDRGGLLSFAAARRVIEATQMDGAFFVRHAPDLVVTRPDAPIIWPGFATTYANVFSAGDYAVYQRVVSFAALADRPTDITFNANMTQRRDLHLRRAAIADVVRPGDLVRVMLTWEMPYVPSFDIQIRLALTANEANEANEVVLVTAQDVIPPDAWRVGENITYHLLALPSTIPTAAPASPADGGVPATFTVGVGVRDGDLGTHEVFTLRIE